MDNKKEYYIGLDMGTNSVGWAVTDTEYNLMRAKGKDLWGVRLFTEAQPAASRRMKRVQRRRVEREKARKAMLRLFFADAIDAVDPGFFQRLDESFLQYEDRSDSNKQMNALFNDGGYTDLDYYNEFPTIFHLRKALLHEDREFDVRLIYLALLNMFSHRGHFLNTNMSSDDDRDNNFDSAWRELIEAFETSQSSNNKEINNISALLDASKYAEIKQIIGDRGKTRSSKFEVLRDLLGVPKSEKHTCAVLKLVCGLKVTVKDLLSNIENPPVDPDGLKVSISFIDSNLEESLDKIQEVLEDEYFEVILKSKSVYEVCLLSSILGNNNYLSDSRVEMYERHKQDLQDLKSLLAEYDKDAYEKIFRTMDVGSYSAYVGSVNSHGNKIRSQVKWDDSIKGEIWTEIIKEKISQQKLHLHDLKLQEAGMLESYITQVEFADKTNREGHAAKVYFNALFGLDFTRGSDIPINAALNYGYALILSSFTRHIAANGYLTQLGLFHDNMFNPFNLASDLMEPFRVIVDRKVKTLKLEVFEKQEKRIMIDILNEIVSINYRQETVTNAIKIYCKSVFDAIENRDISDLRFYQYGI